MKKLCYSLLLVLIFNSAFNIGNAQTKLLWEDQTELISPEEAQRIFSQLAEYDIERIKIFDYSKRCEYLYAELTTMQSRFSLTIYDCNRKTIGLQTWSRIFSGMPVEDRSSIIVYAIVEIIEEHTAQEKSKLHLDKTQKDKQPAARQFSIPFNHHSTRYFFSPSSFNLNQGEIYYNTLYFLLHDMQYGITDNFSVGMGTTILALPFYITPKYTFDLDGLNKVSLGTLFAVGTWGLNFISNLSYATYTYGDQFSNITLGAGHLFTQGDDIENKINSFVINLSGMYRLSDFMYFISENYFLQSTSSHTGRYIPDWQAGTLYYENFSLQNNFIFGATGFRFINKERDIRSFQVGFAYILRYREEVPSRFKRPGWELDGSADKKRMNFFIPIIGLTHKIGSRI